MSWRPKSVRVRLALAYSATFGVLLLLHDMAVYGWVRHEAFEALEEQGARDAASVPIVRGPAYDTQSASVEQELGELVMALLLVIAPGMLLAGAAGYLLAKRALAPVDRLTTHAARITADRLDERVPVANPDDELGRLATTMNAMIARLDASFAALRRFTADASHELRTPLTALRAIGEVSLRERRDPEALREAMGSMLEELDGLTHLVESLLTLARSDDGSHPLEIDDADLSELARRVVDQLATLADEKRQRLIIDLDAPLPVRVDRSLVRRAIANLLDNAIRYSPPGTAITVRSRPIATRCVVEVMDQGPGIAPDDQASIFERFRRLDSSRTRDPAVDGASGGAGLGLALARATIEAHGGAIEVDSAVGAGATFRIVLPNRPPTS